MKHLLQMIWIVAVTACGEGERIGLDTIDGQWHNAGGLYNSDTLRNPHYTFDMTEAGQLSIEITTDKSFAVYIKDSHNIVKGVIYYFSGTKLMTSLDKGSYTLVITAPLHEQGEYYFTMDGPFADFTEVSPNTFKVESAWSNSSNNWQSLRNPQFTFNIEQDNYLDVDVRTEGNRNIVLADHLNNIVAQTQLSHDLQTPIKAGNYTLSVGAPKGSNASFSMEVIGKFGNLAPVEFQTSNFSGTWPGNNTATTHTYSIEITEKSYFDAVVKSGVNVEKVLSNTSEVARAGLGNDLGVELDIGTYTLSISADAQNAAVAYELQLIGKLGTVTDNN